MNIRLIVPLLAISAAIALEDPSLWGQNRVITGVVTQGFQQPAIAVPDFRGSGGAQAVMDTFNKTLWGDLAGSGALKMAAKDFYPLAVPQQPADFKPSSRTVSNGPWLTDWSQSPVMANYLAFGYTAAENGQLVLRAWLYNVGQPDVASADVLGKLYFGTLDAEGAKKVAHEFGKDILAIFGVKSLTGTKIFFTSDRTGAKEIWSMDYDGSNQKRLTTHNSISQFPAVSADGQFFAFTTLTKDPRWQINVYSTEIGKKLPFNNPVSTQVTTPEFTPDGKHLWFAVSFDGWLQLCTSDINGRDFQRISNLRAIEVSPKANPKTGHDILFISGRSGRQQLWRMNTEGADLEMLTAGDGEVANPAWSPDGRKVAFAWTHGFETGGFNIFIMDIASKETVQLTHGEGVNENPWWAQDGVHIVYSSKHGRATQLYTVRADGADLHQLTTQGNNLQPVWAKGLD